jgi:SAM-dependent methyltransferase
LASWWRFVPARAGVAGLVWAGSVRVGLERAGTLWFVRQDEQTRTRSKSFGEIATEYDRFRPGPPDEAIDWLLPPLAADVLELGAGTGGLTRQLVGRVSHVRAVEPDDRMRAVLADRVPPAEVVAGRAEEIPADDSSFDAVMVASAWHWVDEERAVPEVARVLRPGGRLSLLWSGPDRTIDWVRAIFAGGQTLSAERIEAWDARRRERHTVNLGPESPFTEPERRRVSWAMPMKRAEILGLVGTYSVAITMSATAREEHVASISRHLDTQTALATDGTLEMPMRCLCWRAALR